ncbi:MAG: hypothetical protein EPO35_03860 [Acidobacteria bacterium]|nr:MAG: hypothetical protein EPO35_03860 [Acidobacteriota bacterium]
MTIRTYRAGSSVEDYCRACKTDRIHTVIAASTEGHPIRVQCGFCRSEHNYRGGPRLENEPAPAARERERLTGTSGASYVVKEPIVSEQEVSDSPHADLERLLRRVIREEAGITPVTPAPKWRGGTLVLKPGDDSLADKSWPIETFFHKVVMLRNRLRTLEQQVNASDLPEDMKVKLQGYISGCYGSLTSFNVLFADEADQFKGGGE